GRLGPELLDRYRKDFIAAWEKVLGNMKFKPMSADKPQYLTLSAASSPTSPLRRLFEAVRDETMLTRDPPEGSDSLIEAASGNVDVSKLAGGGAGGAATNEAAKLVVRRVKDR